MEYRKIDLETFPRKAHFEYFKTLANPYAGVTVEVDITDFIQKVKKEKLPFFLSFLYCAGRAANMVAELRQRIDGGVPVEFASCDTSHTVMKADGTYGYCRLNCMQPFEEYISQAVAKQEKAKEEADLEDGKDGLSLLFVSTLPWLHYTSLQQPTPIPADSNPRITWGQYAINGEKVTMPVTLLVNHALADGSHMAQFFEELSRQMEGFKA